MEAFRALVELLKDRLWACDVAATAAGSAQFSDMLNDIENHAAARRLWNKALDKDLTRQDIQSAGAFLTRIYGQESGEKKNGPRK